MGACHPAIQAVRFISDGQERNYGNFAKRYPHTSPHLKIRHSLVHPFLSQDKLLISTLMKNRVFDDGVPAILQYRSSDLYLTDRKETMAILKKDTHTLLHICKGLPSFILFPHKINYSYKCILMFRAMHGHLASTSYNIQNIDYNLG